MIKIRRIRQGDETLAREVISNFWPRGQLNREFLKNQTNYLLAAYVDDALAEFLYAYELDRLGRKEPMMFFYSTYVLPYCFRLEVRNTEQAPPRIL